MYHNKTCLYFNLSGIQSLLRNRNGIENRLFDDDLHSDGYYWRYEAIEDLNHVRAQHMFSQIYRESTRFISLNFICLYFCKKECFDWDHSLGKNSNDMTSNTKFSNKIFSDWKIKKENERFTVPKLRKKNSKTVR